MLSEVPMDWQQTTIGEVASLNDESLSTKTSKDYEFRYVSIDDVSTGSINGWTSLAFAEAPSRARRIARQGDILLSTVRPYLKSFTRVNGDDTDLVVSTGFAVLRAGAQINPAYLYQLIFSEPFIEHLKELMTGSNYPAVKPKDIAAFPFALPPVNEQHSIAEILSSVDTSIQATQAVIEQAERVKRGLMEELLTGGLGSEAIERGEVPEGWNVKALSDVAVVKGGKRMPKGAKFSEKPTAYPYIRVSDFANGSISTKDIQYVSPEHQAQIARYTISKEDIYISIAGTLGIVGTVPDELNGAQLTENAAKISIQSTSMIDREFLARVLQSSVGQSQIGIKKGVGGGVPKLALFRIGEINLPIPPLQEQKRISEVLSSIDDFIAAQNSIVEQNQHTKRGLMDDLLTGKVRTA